MTPSTPIGCPANCNLKHVCEAHFPDSYRRLFNRPKCPKGHEAELMQGCNGVACAACRVVYSMGECTPPEASKS